MLLDLKIKLLAKGNSLNFLNNNKYFTKHFLQNVSEYETILYLIQEEVQRLLHKSVAIRLSGESIDASHMSKFGDEIILNIKDSDNSELHKFILISTRECFNESILFARNYIVKVFYATIPKLKDKEEDSHDVMTRARKEIIIDVDYHGGVSTKRSNETTTISCLHTETEHTGKLLQLFKKYLEMQARIESVIKMYKEFNIKKTEKILEYVENLKII